MLNESHKKEKELLLKKDKYDAQETGYNRKIDSLKLSRDDQQEIFNKIQSESFQVAAEIAKAEKDIEYTEQIQTSKKDNINEINSDIKRTEDEINSIIIKVESDNKLLTKSIKDKESLQIRVDEINKNIKESSFSLQNWQSNFNKFLSEKIELDKEIELEKSKIESW